MAHLALASTLGKLIDTAPVEETRPQKGGEKEVTYRLCHPVENLNWPSKMDHETSENNPEITFFIAEGTYRLATISSNDYGFQLSARLALTYLDKAVDMLAAKRTFDRAMLTEIGTLKEEAAQLSDEYVELEKFYIESQRFSRLKTHGVIEWTSKCAVRAISRGYLGNISHRLAYKIRIFHAMTCSILIEP